MKCVFDKCTEAVDFATRTKSFGVYASEIKNPNPDIHVHECCEIFLCLKGGKSFLIDNRIYNISPGDLFVINQFEAHKVLADDSDKFVRYILHVHPSFLYSNSYGNINLPDIFYASDKITKLTLSKEDAEKLTVLFKQLDRDYPYGDEMYKRLRGSEIILETARLFSTHITSSQNAFSHKTVQLAIDYINCNYASPLGVEAVAKNAFISPTQLSRLFNRYCGTTVTKYIVSKRITEAKKLLSSGKSVTDTAFMCGFNDYANFIRTFKKAVGIPPGKYKEFIKKNV